MSGQGQVIGQNVVFHVWGPKDATFSFSWPKLRQSAHNGIVKVYCMGA